MKNEDGADRKEGGGQLNSRGRPMKFKVGAIKRNVNLQNHKHFYEKWIAPSNSWQNFELSNGNLLLE